MWWGHESSGPDPLAGFTLRARKVFHLANQEAHRLNHVIVGVEHLLLGLVKEHAGLASRVLRHRGCSLAAGRAGVGKLALAAAGTRPTGVLARAAEVRDVVERAAREANRLGHPRPGTGHILLAVLGGAAAAVARVFAAARPDPADLRARILAGFAEADWALAEEYTDAGDLGPRPPDGGGGTRGVLRTFSLTAAGGFVGSALGAAFGGLVGLLFPGVVALVCRTDPAAPAVSLGAGLGMVFGLPVGAAGMSVGLYVEAVREHAKAVRGYTETVRRSAGLGEDEGGP